MLITYHSSCCRIGIPAASWMAHAEPGLQFPEDSEAVQWDLLDFI